MFLGSAILLAMILFLVDRNKVWRQFFWTAGSLCLVGVLVIGGFLGWVAWQEHQAHKAAEAHGPWDKYQTPKNEPSAPATGEIAAAPTIVFDEPMKVAKKQKRFGNATVQADSAIVWNGATLITTLFHPARVLVTGEDGSKYQVRLADGRTGEMDMNEIKKDTPVVSEFTKAQPNSPK